MVDQQHERASFRRGRRSGIAGLALAALLTFPAPAALAAEGEVVTIRLQEGQSLRDLAAEHLGDPDLWAEILRLNDLDVGDVRPGIELTIPVGPVANANRALAESLTLIQQATEQGARLFAPAQIGQAIRLRDAALAKRKGGEWDETARLADDAKVAAEEALAAALAQRDATAEALLSDRQGAVQGQRPQDLLWTERLLNAILTEEEKVRTLSRSTAQITFKDDSRLRLSANSQAVIQRMRVDPLSREEEAKVSLVEGDFYALLAGKSERKKFELEVPEVETEIESTNFWVRRDGAGSKFANFDEGALAVSAQGESVSLGRNEATVVRSGAPPSAKIDILPAAALAAPQDDQVAFDAAVEMSWTGVAHAAGYWLEVALDPGFSRMTFSRWGLAEASFESAPLEVGSYYWRVAALDKFGLPGERSEVWRFHVRTDVTPPYLSIGEPAEGGILRQSPLPVQGESEPDATLELDGEPLEVGPDGRFEARYQPQPGLNRLTIKATDAAGNVTERSRSFVFMPDERAAVIFDDALPRLGRTSLSARIDLERLRQFVQSHPFSRTGVLTIVDTLGQKVFDPQQTDLTDHTIVAEAIGVLATGTPVISVEPYERPDGEVMLGAFAFPRPFDWAILVEKNQRDAYLAAEKMLHSLGLWSVIGLAVAVAGAIALALRISRPIVKIERVANEVAQGNFEARVQGVRTRDEVGDLARRMNDMVVGLSERFQLAKFVSAETMAAIKGADFRGVRLGGERRRATMLFCDIRGYTAFAERHDPEAVVEVLNLYFQQQADIVAKHRGDIDKFVGDQIVAVFQEEEMERNAVRCALEIQSATDELGREHPDWDLEVGIGINTGEVIMGAMGSKNRMDFTVLGDNVNLAARLCSHAGPGQTLVTQSTYEAVAECPEFAAEPLTPIVVKGKRKPLPVYQVGLGPTVPEQRAMASA